MGTCQKIDLFLFLKALDVTKIISSLSFYILSFGFFFFFFFFFNFFLKATGNGNEAYNMRTAVL